VIHDPLEGMANLDFTVPAQDQKIAQGGDVMWRGVGVGAVDADDGLVVVDARVFDDHCARPFVACAVAAGAIELAALGLPVVGHETRDVERALPVVLEGLVGTEEGAATIHAHGGTGSAECGGRIFTHVFPPDVVDRAVGEAMYTVSRQIADHHIAQAGAVFQLEYRRLPFGLAAAGKLEALAAAIVGSACGDDDLGCQRYRVAWGNVARAARPCRQGDVGAAT